MSRSLARLLLDTLCLAPVSSEARLAERWARPEVAASARAIAAWIAWEQGEQWMLRRLVDMRALSSAPAKLVESLQLAARTDAKAGLAVDAESVDVLEMLAAKHVPCVLLKGPARRAAKGLYPMADARRTSDVDVLVPSADVEGAWRALVSAGYAPLYPLDRSRARPEESEVWGPSRHHARPLSRPGRAAVELHVSTSWQLSPHIAWERANRAPSSLVWQGLTVRVPSATELLWHGLTHAKPSQPAAWTLRFWLDAAAILAAAEVDWATIAARIATPELAEPDCSREWLAGAAQLAGLELPEAVAPRRPFPLARLLAWRLQVIGRPATGRWREKLLDEGIRHEARLPDAPPMVSRSLPIRVRRRAATTIARATYLGWRLLGG